MLEQMRQIMRFAISLPVRVGIGAILLIFVFANTQKYCEWMACTIYYNFDKPQVIIALVLSAIILGHAGFVIIRSLIKKTPSSYGLEMPTPVDQKDIEHHYLRQPGNVDQDFLNDG